MDRDRHDPRRPQQALTALVTNKLQLKDIDARPPAALSATVATNVMGIHPERDIEESKHGQGMQDQLGGTRQV